MTLAATFLDTVIALVFAAGVATILIAAELDRSAKRHRFAITFRRTHVVTRPGRGAWRWYLHPLFTPDSIDTIVGCGRPPLAGWARTHLGAQIAARCARRALEEELERDRRRFLADLNRGSVPAAEELSRRVSGGKQESA